MSQPSYQPPPERTLDEQDLDPDPLKQFALWFREVPKAGLVEPTAMVLATADRRGRPSGRTVLLKGLDERGFVFYTNYHSRKARELMENPHAALVFNWPELRRQVCVSGTASRVPREESEAYFRTRPRGHQLGAWASRQGELVSGRQALDEKLAQMSELYRDQEVPLPAYWGGFCLKPDSIEFWQGRPNRMHDRLLYRREGERWVVERLSP